MSEPVEAAAETGGSEKQMRLRYAGTCRLCKAPLPARTEAIYERTTKTVRCVVCVQDDDVPHGDEFLMTPVADEPVEQPSAAGVSARREYERRRAKDEARLREKWGRLGGVAVALADEKQSTRAWAQGAVGEERLGAGLDKLVSDSLMVLHDRRVPGSKANIDHMVVTPGGIWVIDAKRYKGRPALKIEGGILRPRVDKLLVGRRDCTTLIDGMVKQVGLVREVAEGIPVTGVLCFIEADWPLLGGAFAIRGVDVVWPKRLMKLLAEQRESVLDVQATHKLLGAHFPPA